jgi:hypothetical protein
MLQKQPHLRPTVNRILEMEVVKKHNSSVNSSGSVYDESSSSSCLLETIEWSANMNYGI